MATDSHTYNRSHSTSTIMITTQNNIEPSVEREESSLDRGIENEEDEIARLWSPYLYSLQRRAPKSRVLPIECELEDSDSSDLGNQYHGLISKAEAIEKLLVTKEGTYLVRKKASGQCVVSFKFSNEIKHRIIKQHRAKFLFEDKEFDSINELVDDTLILLYLEQHDITQHLTLGRAKQQNINAKLRRRNGMRCKTDDKKHQPKLLKSQEKFSESSTADTTDGVFRKLDLEDEPVQVFVENEQGEKLSRAKTSNEKGKNKRIHLRKKRDGNMTFSDRKSCPPNEIVNLLAIYTKPFTGNGAELNKKISTSTGDIPSTGAIGQLLRNTLILHSDDEDASKTNNESTFSRSSSVSYYAKAHNFKIVTYKGPTWCDLCHHYLWGLVQQGMKCQDCGINIHKQCSEDAHETECIPTKKLVKRVFGVDLTTVVLIDNSTVPKFLKQSISELELRGLMTEGIYRVAGRTLHIMELKDSVDENDFVDLSQVQDIHVVSAAIKLFLRELPIPLITFDAYPSLLECIKEKEVQCSTIKELLINHLPRAHYDTLRYVIHHLTKVVDFCHQNKMQSSNLAVVFAPTIMRSSNTDSNFILADISLQKKSVEFLINNYVSVFDP